MLKRKELTSIMITAIIVKMLLLYPRELIINSGQAAWIVVIYVSLISFVLIYFTFSVYRSKKNIIEAAQIIGGKWFKILIGIVAFLMLMANFVPVAKVFSEVIKTVLLVNIPVEIITMVFALIIGIGAYFGLKPIARINFMFLPITGVVFLGFLILLIPYYNINNIMPIFGKGVNSIFVNGINSLSLFSDIILLNILMPFANNLEEIKISARRSVLISAGVSLLITAAYCFSYQYPMSEEFILPMYQLTRIIHISNFFSRFEAFFQFVWSILIFIYSSVYIYAMCSTLQMTFNLKYLKPLIFPITVIAITVSQIPSAITDTIKLERIVNMVEYPLVFLLPLILGTVLRHFKGEKNEIH